jgi:hypothetical protein
MRTRRRDGGTEEKARERGSVKKRGRRGKREKRHGQIQCCSDVGDGRERRTAAVLSVVVSVRRVADTAVEGVTDDTSSPKIGNLERGEG